MPGIPGEITTPESNQAVQTKGKGKAAEEEVNATKSSSSAKLSTNEYQLKAIEWAGSVGGEPRKLKIITQNGNVLILRGSIEIKPYDRSTVTYDYLVELLGDYLFKLIPDKEAEVIITFNNLVNHAFILIFNFSTKIQKGLLQLTIDQSSQKGQNQQAHSADLLNGIDENNQKTDNDSIAQITNITNATRPSLQDYQHTLNAAISIIPILQTGLDVNVRFNSIHGFEPTAELSVFDIFGVELVHGWVVDPQDEETWNVVVGKCGSYNKAVECVVGGDSVSKGVVLESSDGVSNIDFDKSERSANAMENVRVRDVVWESLIDVDQSASEFVNGQFRKGEISGGDYVGVTDNEAHGGGDQDLQQQEDERETEFRRKQQQRQEDLQRQQRRQNRPYDQTSIGSSIATETSEKERRKDREKRTSCFIS
ncbi:16142_t:CDS:2 [Racocetra fulgida]|uniref:16142_t:CDS:1 n=1 Tax=Racocetra fulgida TaxID=60492 RepID=A0A9N9AST4_9GLOM|nr:16142_t:CDS:2 [Racocetra fulgida]